MHTQELVSPIKFDKRQAEFVRLYIETGDRYVAAKSAGYSEGTAKNATQLLNQPNIAFAITAVARYRLASKVPMALAVLEHLAEHAVSERVRMESATRLLDRAGLAPPKALDERRDPEKPIHELSISELRAKADQLEQELAARARDITPDPTTELIEPTRSSE
jgi:hypothetical protein